MTPTARSIALDVLVRVDEGAYANLATPAALGRSRLADADRRFVTELVYGTTRMRRALDHLVDGHLRHEPDIRTRTVLRLGAYQLAFLHTPAHAAVGETVAIAPPRTKGLVNAVLRKVAATLDAGEVHWPSPAVELSYPDWVVERLVADLGPPEALRALVQMNQAATVSVRDDDYVQDPASQAVIGLVGGQPGEVVVDLCAAPGGKATGIARSGAFVAAGDIYENRSSVVVENADRLGSSSLAAFCGDASRPPFRDGIADRVLLDAPCSGLGVLRRRPDARWRIEAGDVDRLATLQRRLFDAAAKLVKPGGLLTYSVCTLAAAETIDIGSWAVERYSHFDVIEPPSAPWQPWGRGSVLLPHVADTDGMFVLQLQRRP